MLVTTRKCKNAKLIHMKMPQKPQYIEACDGLHWIYRKLDLIKSYFYDIIHFLRREMLDFTAFPVFFVSNLLLVQRKKYYFNRATVSRNCSIVL